jgi:predicted DNA-binding transcriptional regulator YafY
MRQLLKILSLVAIQARTAKELQERLNALPNTIHRDLRLLLSMNLIQHQDTHYSSTKTNPFRLNDVESLAVYSALRLFYHHATEYNEHYRSALEKMTAMLRGAPQQLALEMQKSFAKRKNAKLSRNNELIATAWLEGRWLNADYQNPYAEKARKIRLAVYFLEINPQNHATYVIGFDATGKQHDIRIFKLSRLSNVQLLEETYTIPTDFNPFDYLATAWGIMRDDDQTVRLRFNPSLKQYLTEEHFSRETQCQHNADGSTEITLQVGGTLELIPWIRGWGASVEVLEPLELREELIAEAQAVLRLYQTTNF